MYRIEQYVMAYRADHGEIKKLLPDGYESLRPVLRINAEIITDMEEIEGEQRYIEFNTPVAAYGKRGWFNLDAWDTDWNDITGIRDGRRTRFTMDIDGTEFLDILFAPTGAAGGCPREDDNDGTFFIDDLTGETLFMEAEIIQEKKEYCDCEFSWQIPESEYFCNKPGLIRQAMTIEPEEILGAYAVVFHREAERAEGMVIVE